MATIDELIRAAEAANARATHYAATAKRLYDTLLSSKGTLTKEQVEKYYDAIESNRSSAKAAEDLLGEILKELLAATAGQT